MKEKSKEKIALFNGAVHQKIITDFLVINFGEFYDTEKLYIHISKKHYALAMYNELKKAKKAKNPSEHIRKFFENRKIKMGDFLLKNGEKDIPKKQVVITHYLVNVFGNYYNTNRLYIDLFESNLINDFYQIYMAKNGNPPLKALGIDIENYRVEPIMRLAKKIKKYKIQG